MQKHPMQLLIHLDEEKQLEIRENEPQGLDLQSQWESHSPTQEGCNSPSVLTNLKAREGKRNSLWAKFGSQMCII